MVPEIDVHTTREADVVRVVVRGEIALSTSTRLNRELDAVLDLHPGAVRLDLTEVSFMDTTGVAVLLKGRRRATEHGCRLTVASSSPAIARVLEITGLTALLSG